MDKKKFLKLSQNGFIRIIELYNPPVNFIVCDMIKDLYYELLRIRDDYTTRVIVITSAVKDIFISHYDPQELSDLNYSGNNKKMTIKKYLKLTYKISKRDNRHMKWAQKFPWYDRRMVKSVEKQPKSVQSFYFWSRCIDIIETMNKPIICAINGLCLGGALEFALACDFRYMATGKYNYIGFTEVLSGIIPGGVGSILRLVNIVGEAKATQMLMTGDIYTASQAEKMGIIHKVSIPKKLIPEVLKLAKDLSEKSGPIALASIKKSIRKGSRMTFDKGRLIEKYMSVIAFYTQDAQISLKNYSNYISSMKNKVNAESIVKSVKFVKNSKKIYHKGT